MLIISVCDVQCQVGVHMSLALKIDSSYILVILASCQNMFRGTYF